MNTDFCGFIFLKYVWIYKRYALGNTWNRLFIMFFPPCFCFYTHVIIVLKCPLFIVQTFPLCYEGK